MKLRMCQDSANYIRGSSGKFSSASVSVGHRNKYIQKADGVRNGREG